MQFRFLAVVVLLLAGAFGMGSRPSLAAESGAEPPHQHWHHDGVLGTFDRGQLQRGYLVYKQVCASCHGMKYLSFRNLEDIGFSALQVKAIAAEYEVEDGPNDEGEMFMRPATPADRFPQPFRNEAEARYANNGAYPPDLSLIVKARHHGADYIYALLTGYQDEPPPGEELGIGMYWNEYFKGHQIAMAPPLYDDAVTYEDGTDANIEQMAEDVTAFMAWASEPHMETRKQMGLMVILFLTVFAGVMYAAKRYVWADVKHH